MSASPEPIAKRGGKQAQLGALLGIVVSAALLFVLFRGLDWAELGKILLTVNYLHFVTFAASFYLVNWARAVRWRYLLPAENVPDTGTLACATIVGALATFTLPLRAGEFVRPLALARWSKVPFSTGFATVVTERVFDVLAILTLLGLSLSRVPELPQLAVLGAKALAALAVVISLGMIFAYLRSDLMVALFRRVVLAVIKNQRLAERLIGMFEQFLSGIKAIGSLKELLLIVFWSFVLWLNMAVYFQVGLWAMGIYPSMVVGVLVTVLVALAVAAPSAPGFLGTFQVGCVAALQEVLGYPHETAIAYSLLVHFSQVLIIVAGGCLVLYFKGVGLSELRRPASEC